MEIWKSEYELRQFIYLATHTWNIESVFKRRTEHNPYSIFENSINQARSNFDDFSLQLIERLSDTNNWKAIEIDLRDKFIPMIIGYIDWYKTHETELQRFDPYNPYSLMLDVVEQTKREILKYFPESLPQPEKREDEERVSDFPKTPTIGEDIKTAIVIIAPLKGYWNRNRILKDDDFNRLVEYIELIIKNKPIPETMFPTTGAPNVFISKTIYEVYRNTGKKHREQFIELVHLFRQFENTEKTTTNSKFSYYPNDYEADINTHITF